VLFRIDAVILGALGGDAQLASYTVGYRLMETVLFVTWSVSRSLLPVLVRAEPGRARVKVGESALAVAGAVLVPYGVVMLLNGADVLRLLFGADYAQTSAASLQWLAFAPVAFAVHYFAGYLLFLHGHKQAMMLTTCFAVVLNVGLNVLLIPAFGAEGAAFATTASYVVTALLRIALLARAAAWFRLNRGLGLCVVAAVPMAVALLLIDQPLIVEALTGGVVYVAAYLLFAVRYGPEQIAVLRSMVRGR
jgi:O-antigen/teichoic acid export membrane protein